MPQPSICNVCNDLATIRIFTIKTGTMSLCNEHAKQFEKNGKFDFEY